jgi:hypothetical protein
VRFAASLFPDYAGVSCVGSVVVAALQVITSAVMVARLYRANRTPSAPLDSALNGIHDAGELGEETIASCSAISLLLASFSSLS